MIRNFRHWLHSETEIYNAVLVPSRLDTVLGGVPVSVTLETDYPFKGLLHYTVSAEENTVFTLRIRIPSWAEKVSVSGLSDYTRSEDSLYTELAPLGIRLSAAGDCKKTGKVAGAVHSGFFAAMDIGKF